MVSLRAPFFPSDCFPFMMLFFAAVSTFEVFDAYIEMNFEILRTGKEMVVSLNSMSLLSEFTL